MVSRECGARAGYPAGIAPAELHPKCGKCGDLMRATLLNEEQLGNNAAASLGDLDEKGFLRCAGDRSADQGPGRPSRSRAEDEKLVGRFERREQSGIDQRLQFADALDGRT